MMKNKSALALTLAGLLAALACNLGGATPQLATAALPIVAPTAPPTEHASPITPAVESQTPTPTLAPAQGQAFYVAPNGEDADPGTLDQPWRTIQHAADTLGAGETVYVRAGTYSEDVVLRRSGAPGSPVTFAAYPGEQVILDGGGTLNSAFETDFSEPDPKASDITISGFRIQNYKAFGIVAWSVNDRLTFTDLVVQHNGSEGIRLSNSDGSLIQNVLLQNNEGGFDCTPVLPGAESDPGCTHLHIADAQSIDNGTQGDTGTDAFAVERGADILVERSLATGGPGDGFDFKSDRTILSQVTAHDTRNNIKMWGKDSLLVNALAYDAKADASLVLVAGGSYTVLNVTIANMAATAYLVVAADTSGSGPTPIRIDNSLFYNDNPAMEGTLLYFGPEAQLTDASNNLYYNPYRTDAVICADAAPFSGQCFSDADINGGAWKQTSNQYADPRFVNPAAKDFRLAADSPARDAGTSQVEGLPTLDLFANPRVAGVAVDLGAIEAP